jgi:hypothetical protein
LRAGSGSSFATKAALVTASATESQIGARKPKKWATPAPIAGPKMIASPNAAPTSPIAAVRSLASERSAAYACAVGSVAELSAPPTIREPTSATTSTSWGSTPACPSLADTPNAPKPIAYPTMPSKSTGFRPRISLRRPQ